MSSGKRLPERPGPLLSQRRNVEDRMGASPWACPNTPPCRHGRILHDGDGVDEPFVCCAAGCDCRQEPARRCRHCYADLTRHGEHWIDGDGWFRCTKGVDHEPLPEGDS